VSDSLRVDRWLHVARFFRTRTLAQGAVSAGHVRVNGERARPSREVAAGDTVEFRAGGQAWEVRVLGVIERRGGAQQARALYEETVASAARRQAEAAAREAGSWGERTGRPTKRERRDLERWRGGT
jgi:ribosome-associated heat shock protein Hsp15